MFVTFRCKVCESDMKLNFDQFAERARNTGYGAVRCLACGNQFPTNIAYALYGFISEFTSHEPQWEISFSLSERTGSKHTEN
jgi:hypothetical protein